ncbi:MAG: carbohydrate kinase family protein [Micrococcaceae bacterium]
MSDYVGVIGEALVDVVVSDTAVPRAHPGGSPLNVAVGLARLGETVLFAGRYGTDDHGQVIQHHLETNQVHSVLDADELSSSVATARLDPTGAATYEFELDWTLPGPDELWERFRTVMDQLDGQQDLAHLHMGSIATMLAPGAVTVMEMLRRLHPTATISYDPNCRPSIIPDRAASRARAEESAALADVVHASDEDLHWLYPELTLQQIVVNWQALGPAIVVVTRGATDILCATAEGTWEQPIVPVEVADTVGAGDSFTSALLVALHDRGLLGAAARPQLRELPQAEVASVLAFAAQAAAITSSRPGADPPSRDELDAAVAAHSNTGDTADGARRRP